MNRISRDDRTEADVISAGSQKLVVCAVYTPPGDHIDGEPVLVS